MPFVTTMARPFGIVDHGSILALETQRPCQALQFVIGNPLIAVQITLATTWPPLCTRRCACWWPQARRVQLSNTISRRRCSANPVSLKVARVARGLDQKVQDLVSAMVRVWKNSAA